jgi:hypothetical protein
MSERRKKPVCVYLEAELLDRARRVRDESGVPFSRLVSDGVRRQLVKFEALEVIARGQDER